MDRVKDLSELLLKAKQVYYTTGVSIMSDAEYDTLESELQELDPINKVLMMVGTDSFIPNREKVALKYWMCSTDKAFSMDELRSYRNRTAGTTEYLVSQKVDGMAVDLTYEGGLLKNASTRGNGTIGRTFINRAMDIPVIQKSLPVKFTGKVRGEIFLTYAGFDLLNEILAAGGEEAQSNCRNSAAGLINNDSLLNPEKKLQLLNFRAYGLYDEDGEVAPDDWGSYATYSQQLQHVWELGYTPVEYNIYSSLDAIDFSKMEAWIKGFDFPNDGIVIRVNNNEQARKMGRAEKYLNAVTAYKFKPDFQLVKVTGIEWSIGSREIVPVIKIEPIELEGATVTSVGGHSVKNLIDIEAAPGNYISIIRSGGVIPRAYHRNMAS